MTLEYQLQEAEESRPASEHIPAGRELAGVGGPSRALGEFGH
jgi:hypothetical protein